ncbi:MAG: efflux RND transporter permease subunit, partial [Planctomycetes bacterium]|nr:efflux RND transporter permease subunit [Planctomycetota bacterium]
VAQNAGRATVSGAGDEAGGGGGGVYAGLTLVRELFPESRPNRVLIATLYPGAPPSEIEKGITLKIEEQIKDVVGVDKITSRISEGRSTIIVEMRSGFDAIDQAVLDIKTAVDSIPKEDFPEEALETRVAKFEPTLPVISVSLYGPRDDRTLKDMGERLRNDVLALPGVTNVRLTGTRKDEISVEVRPEKLAEYNLSFMEVAEAIAVSNLDLPGGQIRTSNSNVAVRTLGERNRGRELYDIIVRSDSYGNIVELRDVATIVDGFEDSDIIGRYQASPAISVIISKTPEQDAVEIAQLVRAMVAGKRGESLERGRLDRLLAKLSGRDTVREVYEQALADPYPEGIRIEAHRDLSRFIEQRLDLLQRNGLWGLSFVFLSLLMFLNWRVAFWVLMGLVLSVTGALMAMKFLGLTLNLITAFGLIMILGLLVDDAIIVSEHVYSKIEQGVEPKLAAIVGTEEVTGPVVCAVFTTIVAFFPLAWIEGQLGDWLGVLPVVACVALFASLIEALAILPSHLAHGLKPKKRDGIVTGTGILGMVRRGAGILQRLQDKYIQGVLQRNYERLLRTAAAYRYVTLAALLAVLMIMVGVVGGGHVPFVFIQKMDSDTVFAKMEMSVGSPIEATQEAAAVIEKAAMRLPELMSLFTLLGAQVDDEGVGTPPQSHVAQIFLELTPGETRSRSSDDILRVLRDGSRGIPGVEKLQFDAIHGGPGGATIQVEISGERLEDLIAATTAIKDLLASYEGVYDIIDDSDNGRREIQIELFGSARALGLSTRSLATQVRAAFYGFEARKVQRGREDVKIMVRYPLAYRTRVYDVESMRVATPSGALVPFTEVARIKEGTGYGSIVRKNQKRTVTVTADCDQAVTNADTVMNDLSLEFPKLQREYPGTLFEFGGQKLEMKKSMDSLRTAFPVALGLIYVMLAGLFKSYVQPLIVMAVIPFGFIGVVVGHLAMDYPLTIMSMFGMVALTGIVVNDSMILMVFINRRVEDGEPLFEAVIAGGLGRLRPILLTSVTTVLGLAPLIFEQSFQAKFLIPMGIAISAGLVFATVLTLVAVPAMYLVVFDLKKVSRQIFRWLFGLRRQTADVSAGT